MIKFLKITGIVVGVLVLIVIALLFYVNYKVKHIKDTHDLQARVKTSCDKYLQDDKGTGLFVGIIQNGKVYTVGYGMADKESKITPDSNTIFEIGSISKVFTASIAQILVEQGQLNWEDHVYTHLPQEAKPAHDDSTKLLHLVTHTSGMPRLPESWYATIEANECDPYSKLTMADLYSTVRKAEQKTPPSFQKNEYSNLGMGLLGHILEWKTGQTYEQMVQQYITQPLNMNSTYVTTGNSQPMATGYNEKGEKTCHWTLPILPGAGAIKSNGADMLRFLQANMDSTGALSKSFNALHSKEITTNMGPMAYGWHIDMLSGIFSGIRKIVWHNGGTGGFRSYIGFIPGRNTGVIVLSNQSHDDFDKLAIGILRKAGTISLK